MGEAQCPCYVCLVAIMCPGKEPTPEEHNRMLEELDVYEKEHGCECFQDTESVFDDYDIPPELEAQINCPMYKEWSRIKSPEEFDDTEYLGIEFPKMKVLGEKEIEFHKRQNRKIC